MTRVLTFKVPLGSHKTPPASALSDRSSTWDLVQQLGPGDEKKRSPPNQKEELVLLAFKMPPDALLDMPHDVVPPPFTYHLMVNGEPNYVSYPRLSVSKLLTDSWCELREYYEIYAGLPRFAPTTRMQAGSDYHKKLEDADHAVVDAKSVDQLIKEALEKVDKEQQEVLTENEFGASLAGKWMEQVVVRLLGVPERGHAREVYVHGFLNFETGKLATNVKELSLGVLVNGVADIVRVDRTNPKRKFTVEFPPVDEWGMAKVGKGREYCAASGIANTDSDTSCVSDSTHATSKVNDGNTAASTDVNADSPIGVTVNAAADTQRVATTQLSDSATTSDGASVNVLVDALGAVHISPETLKIVDLAVELPRARQLLDELAKSHHLHVRDVKTRSRNSVPEQELVVHAAHVQCMYYAQFLSNLAQSTDFAYASNNENARRRGVDPDTPLGPAWVAKLLLGNFGVLALDMVRLAEGRPIGFDAYDRKEKEAKERKHITAESGICENSGSANIISERVGGDYSLANFVSEEQFRSMLSHIYGSIDFNISALFRPWARPLTISYFSARAAQAFNVVHSFPPASVCIEYHNLKTQRIIAAKHAPFSIREFKASSKHACLFWSGRRRPEHTEDRSRCKHCDFRNRCVAVNKPAEKMAGAAIYRFIEGFEEESLGHANRGKAMGATL